MTTVRCPRCGARCRSDSSWCTLCHTRLDEAARPDDLPGDAEPTSGAFTGGTLDPTVVDELVATLAATEGGVALPGAFGGPAVLGRTGSARGQALVAGGGVAVVLAVLLLVMTVVGLLV